MPPTSRPKRSGPGKSLSKRGPSRHRHAGSNRLRQAEPGMRLAWRDAVLDQLVTTLSKESRHPDLSRRLSRYVETGRELEVEATRDAEASDRFKEFTAETLADLRRKRTDSSYRAMGTRYRFLAGRLTTAKTGIA